MNIGTRMKKRRKELGLSADKLASMIGKDRSTVFRYERGDIENLPLDILEPISNALLTTPAYLMGWEDEEEKTATQKDSGMSEAKQQLLALAESCSDEEATRLLQMMELFLGKR